MAGWTDARPPLIPESAAGQEVLLFNGRADLMDDLLGEFSRHGGTCRVLNLENCTRVTRIEPATSFIQLQKLCMDGCNGLSEIALGPGAGHAAPLHLQHLSLFNCGVLQKLTLEDLPALEVLVLDNCAQLKDVCLKRLPRLREISFKNNAGLHTLMLEQCDSLESLDFSDDCTELRTLSIKAVPRLSRLGAAGSACLEKLITDGSFDGQLLHLNLRDCARLDMDVAAVSRLLARRKDYPLEGAFLSLEGCHKFGATAQLHPCIWNTPDDCRTSFLHSLERFDTEVREPLNYFKVLVLGDAWAGKSTLIKAIVSGKPVPVGMGVRQRTEGIDQTTWTYEPDARSASKSKAESSLKLTFDFWDFGGQEVLHQAHQRFLRSQSLYVIAWSPVPPSAVATAELSRFGHSRKALGGLEYWITALVRHNKDACILLVQTNSTPEEAADRQISRAVSEEKARLVRKKYENNLFGKQRDPVTCGAVMHDHELVHNVSIPGCARDAMLHELTMLAEHNSRTSFSRYVPGSDNMLVNVLLDLRKDCPSIGFDEFIQHMQAAGIKSTRPELALVLAERFSAMGVIYLLRPPGKNPAPRKHRVILRHQEFINAAIKVLEVLQTYTEHYGFFSDKQWQAAVDHAKEHRREVSQLLTNEKLVIDAGAQERYFSARCLPQFPADDQRSMKAQGWLIAWSRFFTGQSLGWDAAEQHIYKIVSLRPESDFELIGRWGLRLRLAEGLKYEMRWQQRGESYDGYLIERVYAKTPAGIRRLELNAHEEALLKEVAFSEGRECLRFYGSPPDPAVVDKLKNKTIAISYPGGTNLQGEDGARNAREPGYWETRVKEIRSYFVDVCGVDKDSFHHYSLLKVQDKRLNELKMMRSDVVIFLLSDDFFMSPNTIEELLLATEENNPNRPAKRVTVFDSDLDKDDKRKKFAASKLMQQWNKKKVLKPKITPQIFKGNMIASSLSQWVDYTMRGEKSRAAWMGSDGLRELENGHRVMLGTRSYDRLDWLAELAKAATDQ